MKALLVLLACVSVYARTPLDTVVTERSDSGNHYVKLHVPALREQTVYTRYTVESIPANTVTQLLDSAKGAGTVHIPPMTRPSRYALDLSLFSQSNTTWNYSLKLDTITLFTSSTSASKIQVRTLEIYASPARNKLYLRRTNRGDDGSVSTVDSTAFTSWGNYHRVYWTVNPSNPATILGVRGAIEY